MIFNDAALSFPTKKKVSYSDKLVLSSLSEVPKLEGFQWTGYLDNGILRSLCIKFQKIFQ